MLAMNVYSVDTFDGVFSIAICAKSFNVTGKVSHLIQTDMLLIIFELNKFYETQNYKSRQISSHLLKLFKLFLTFETISPIMHWLILSK